MTESSKVSKVGDGQDSIHFHSSPNFLKMKKFFKNRIEETASLPVVTPAQIIKVAKELEACPAAAETTTQPQPPLPLDPPPCPTQSVSQTPSTPIDMIPPVQIKQEILDVTEIKQEVVEAEEEAQKAPAAQKKMCRDFARGKCNRGIKCIFRHEIDINQLEGVYEFCKDYQNKGCKYPVCKYVHATVKEEGIYRKTGVMPVSVKNREAQKAKAAPTPAPKTATLTYRQEFLMPPPPPPPKQPSVAPPPPLPQSNYSAPQPSAAATNFNNMFAYPRPPPNPILPGQHGGLLADEASRKRAWNELADYSSVLSMAEMKRSNTAKCRHCGLLEDSIFGLTCQCEKASKAIEDYGAKTLLLEKKYHRMLNCLVALVQTSQDSVPDTGSLNPFAQLLRSNYATPSDVAAQSNALAADQVRLWIARSLARLTD